MCLVREISYGKSPSVVHLDWGCSEPHLFQHILYFFDRGGPGESVFDMWRYLRQIATDIYCTGLQVSVVTESRSKKTIEKYSKITDTI